MTVKGSTGILIGLWLLVSPLSYAADAADRARELRNRQFAADCGLEWDAYRAARRLYFTDGNYSASWRAISAKQLQDCENCFQSAALTLLPTRHRVMELTRSSKSGDWVQVFTYCFAPSGRLTQMLSITEPLMTEYPFALVRTYVPDQNGSLVQQTAGFVDRKTGEPIAKPAEVPFGRDLLDDVPAYSDVSRLLFAKLLAKN